MALSGQYIELSEIIERVYRKYPITEEIKISDAALWTFDISAADWCAACGRRC